MTDSEYLHISFYTGAIFHEYHYIRISVLTDCFELISSITRSTKHASEVALRIGWLQSFDPESKAFLDAKQFLIENSQKIDEQIS